MRRWRRVWRFVLARLDRGSELGLGLTISVLLFAGGIWAFSVLLEDVLEAESLVRWDAATNDWFHAHQSGGVTRAFRAVTQFGSPVVVSVVVLVAVWLVSRDDRVMLWAWVASNAGGFVLQWVLKATVHRARPPYAAAYLHGVTYSFPSGHAMTSTIGYGMLAYLLCAIHGWRGWRRGAAYGAAGLIAFAVGLSRIVLTVHFPSDVGAGFVAGAAWLGACFTVFHVIRWRSRRRVG